MQGFAKFVRDHFVAGIFLVILVSALLYKPIRDSSPVVRRSLSDGRIVAMVDSGPNRWGRMRPAFRYQIELIENGKIIYLNDFHLREINSMVLIETTVRNNGHTTFNIALSFANRNPE